jgi:hypothetical protein
VLAGVALVCGVTFTLAREQGFVEASIELRSLAGAWRVLFEIPRDIVVVCSEAVAQAIAPKPARGSFRAVRYGAVEETPQGAGRRAMSEAFGSLAPNTVVLGIDTERELLLVHQLRKQGGPEDLDVLRVG